MQVMHTPIKENDGKLIIAKYRYEQEDQCCLRTRFRADDPSIDQLRKTMTGGRIHTDKHQAGRPATAVGWDRRNNEDGYHKDRWPIHRP